MILRTFGRPVVYRVCLEVAITDSESPTTCSPGANASQRMPRAQRSRLSS